MSSRTLVHRLLFDALLEMRERGRASGDKAVFHLADLFHNAALQMENAETTDDFDRILEFLRLRSAERGFEAWLDSHLKNLPTAQADA